MIIVYSDELRELCIWWLEENDQLFVCVGTEPPYKILVGAEVKDKKVTAKA